MEIRLKHNLWGNGKNISLNLSDRWKVSVLNMKGDSKPLLKNNHIRTKILSLTPFIKDKKEVCVVFDDLSRPTKAFKIVPFLIELFEKNGIRDEQVRFICGLGTHAALDNRAFRKKLGQEAMERFHVFNHNPYENCDFLGRTKLGTPIMINREYMSCDLRIGIGSFTPHAFCGYGGGYKIVMPSISHIDSIEYHHGTLLQRHRETCFSLGKYEDNPLLDDIIECGRTAGLDIKIDCLINTGAEITDLYAGRPDSLYEYMLQRAQYHYSTPVPGKADIVFVNSYSKANEAVISLSIAESVLKDTGGFIVLLCDVPEGQIIHYLFGRFGKNTWGRLPFGVRKKADKAKGIFIYSRYRDIANEFWFGREDGIYWYKDIKEIIGILEDEYHNKTPEVFIIPDATIQKPSE